jgi:hypothetical protein
MFKNYVVSTAGSRARILYMSAQETVAIYKLTVDSIRSPDKVYFEQDSEYINWGEVQRLSGVSNAHKPYRLDV